MDEHVVLLGDLKGTKNMLQNYVGGRDRELVTRVSELRRVFSSAILKHLDQCRSMKACAFSDSVLAQWDDAIEGVRTVCGLAHELKEAYQNAELQVRLFADLGISAPASDDLGRALAATTHRYVAVVPVSTAVWSVFVAEASHFPDGVFIGEQLADRLKIATAESSDSMLSAGPFNFWPSRQRIP